MLSERHDDGFFLDGQDRRFGFLRSRRHVRDRGPPLPLGDRLLIDPVALRQSPQALLTMLYRSTDRLCRRGASMKNLAHSASLESLDKNAPSNIGTKHLGLLTFRQLAPSVPLPARSLITCRQTSARGLGLPQNSSARGPRKAGGRRRSVSHPRSKA